MAQEWTFPKNYFSFIHVRGFYGSIRDWSDFYKEAYDAIEPGGWFEQAEVSVVPISDDGSVTLDHIFTKWGKNSLKAAELFGKPLTIWKDAKELLGKAGFEEVTEKVYKLPIGGWSSDPKLKDIGMWNQLYWEYGVEAWSMALMTRVLGVCITTRQQKLRYLIKYANSGRTTKYRYI